MIIFPKAHSHMYTFMRIYIYFIKTYDITTTRLLQLIVNHEYDINITIFDADDHVIHPSENILTKTTFGKQFDVIDISVGTKIFPITRFLSSL